MRRAKKTEVFSIRIEPELAKVLRAEASKVDWYMPQLIRRILVEWAKNEVAKGGSFNFVDGGILLDVRRGE